MLADAAVLITGKVQPRQSGRPPAVEVLAELFGDQVRLVHSTPFSLSLSLFLSLFLAASIRSEVPSHGSHGFQNGPTRLSRGHSCSALLSFPLVFYTDANTAPFAWHQCRTRVSPSSALL